MAFDPISGTIATVSLITIISVSIALYINMQNQKKLMNEQIEDLISQFNKGQRYMYNTFNKSIKATQDTTSHLDKKYACVRCPQPASAAMATPGAAPVPL